MDDLVKRLREVDPMDYPGPACEAMEEAAAAIEAPQAEVARLGQQTTGEVAQDDKG